MEEIALADWLELRLDQFQNSNWTKLLEEKKKPVIVSCPILEERGFYSGSKEQRAKLLFRAALAGADAIDIDWRAASDLPDLPPGCKKIVSYHDWEKTPADLLGIEKELRAHGDIVKIVTMAHSLQDNRASLQLLETVQAPTISFAMGEKGRLSRILAPLFGSLWSYASSAEGEETAPGQLTVAEMRALYPPGCGKQTQIFGVVGFPLSHSLSPLLHSMGLRALNLDALYLSFEAEDFQEFTKLVSSTRFQGFSVTHPYKEEAFRGSVHPDTATQSIGAANTWVREAKGWKAYNTDAPAAVECIEKAMKEKISGRRVLILGAGGAARAVAFALKNAGAKVSLAGRQKDKTEKVATQLQLSSILWEEIKNFPYDLLIQATSVGMKAKQNESVIAKEWIQPGSWVFDLVYNPAETQFLRFAKEQNARTISGVEMFLLQAMKQFELFTRSPAPEKMFRSILQRELSA